MFFEARVTATASGPPRRRAVQEAGQDGHGRGTQHA
jgi:hypothetical protein